MAIITITNDCRAEREKMKQKPKKKKAKPVYAWCIKYRGTLAFETCNFRNKCISFFTDKMNNRMQLFSSHIDDWPSLKKEGYRCVKVRIEEI